MFKYAGSAMWILSTSMLLLVMPLGMEIEKEQMVIQWENEQKAMMQQQRQVRASELRRSGVEGG